MSMTIDPETPPLRVDESGAIRVGDTRIVLDLVVEAHLDGASPDEIVEMYPTLLLGDVYGAIGYYLRHREEVNAYIEGRTRQADEARGRIEANQPAVDAIRARLRERRSGLQG